jgi:succinate dehydrogenase / fumarate reductase cytochrome b subunit
MSITGLFLISFLIVHLAVNLLTLSPNPDLFNEASHFMATNPFIQIMQYVLALGFILHIVSGIRLELQNRAARPTKYAFNRPGENSDWNSRNMIKTGLLVMLFLILHLRDYFWELKFGDLGGYTNDYDLVVNLFDSWYYTLLYVISFVLLAMHLNHGFQSAFQSVGVNHEKYTPFIKLLGKLYSYIVPGGFALIAIYHYLF